MKILQFLVWFALLVSFATAQPEDPRGLILPIEATSGFRLGPGVVEPPGIAGIRAGALYSVANNSIVLGAYGGGLFRNPGAAGLAEVHTAFRFASIGSDLGRFADLRVFLETGFMVGSSNQNTFVFGPGIILDSELLHLNVRLTRATEVNQYYLEMGIGTNVDLFFLKEE
jgi:hypothetical protein